MTSAREGEVETKITSGIRFGNGAGQTIRSVSSGGQQSLCEFSRGDGKGQVHDHGTALGGEGMGGDARRGDRSAVRHGDARALAGGVEDQVVEVP